MSLRRGAHWQARNGPGRTESELFATSTERRDGAADTRRTRRRRGAFDTWILCRSSAPSLTLFGGSGSRALIRNELEDTRVVAVDRSLGQLNLFLVLTIKKGVHEFFQDCGISQRVDRGSQGFSRQRSNSLVVLEEVFRVQKLHARRSLVDKRGCM
jgi:hypothetical protein